jgi:hypothetical protein
VPLIAVELDHQTVADHQVNPADFVDLNLHVHLQPMGAKAEPCQSLETRLAPSICQCEQTASSGDKHTTAIRSAVGRSSIPPVADPRIR